jgi:hypothetical protein
MISIFLAGLCKTAQVLGLGQTIAYLTVRSSAGRGT